MSLRRHEKFGPNSASDDVTFFACTMLDCITPILFSKFTDLAQAAFSTAACKLIDAAKQLDNV